MIGQGSLIEYFNNAYSVSNINNNLHPKFMLLVGDKGSGKKTVLYDVFGASAVYVTGIDNKPISIDQIRSLINMANHMHDTIFIVHDMDKISPSSQNALLKVVEELPNDNSFIGTVSNISNLLSTIRSRAQVVYMRPYTLLEKRKIAEFIAHGENNEYVDDIVQICETPGDMITIYSYNPNEFMDYIHNLYYYLPTSSLTNAFAYADRIALKADSPGYDLSLVWRGYKNFCCKMIKEYMEGGCKSSAYNPEEDFSRIKLTNEFLNTLQTNGVNKSMLFGAWIMKIIQI